MPELRSHKLARSLNQRLFSKSEHRFITASGEVEAQAEGRGGPMEGKNQGWKLHLHL
jgi:hypothetical protein